MDARAHKRRSINRCEQPLSASRPCSACLHERSESPGLDFNSVVLLAVQDPQDGEEQIDDIQI